MPPFRGQDFYSFASTLFAGLDSKSPDEAAIRSIVSRAYYAAFLQARDFASLGGTSPTIHAEVREHYKTRGVAGNRVSNKLADLIHKRKVADYETKTNVVRRDAEKALKLSEAILQDLAAIFNKPFP